MKRFLFFLCLLFLLLIFHQETTAGVTSGLLLWYQILIPALLPFLLVTNALSGTNAYQSLTRFVSPKKSGYGYALLAFFLGNLCGYPIGGKILNDFVRQHQLTEKQALQIVSVSSQVSPMFLLGYIYHPILKEGLPLFVLLGSVYLPCIFLFCIRIRKTFHTSPAPVYIQPSSLAISDTFLHAVEIMVNIGIYVMIFSILLSILLPRFHNIPFRLLLSSLEITNGLNVIRSLPLPVFIRTAGIGALTAFGGFCSMFQIRTVAPFFSIKKYLCDKLLLSTGTFLFLLIYLKLEFVLH